MWNLPFTCRGDRSPGAVGVGGGDAFVDRKHASNDDLLLLHVLVAVQREPGLQFAGGRCWGTPAKAGKSTKSKPQKSDFHATLMRRGEDGSGAAAEDAVSVTGVSPSPWGRLQHGVRNKGKGVHAGFKGVTVSCSWDERHTVVHSGDFSEFWRS